MAICGSLCKQLHLQNSQTQTFLLENPQTQTPLSENPETQRERERKRLSSEEKEIELKGGRGGQDSKSSKVLPTNNQIYLTLPPCWGNGGGMGWGGAGLS